MKKIIFALTLGILITLSASGCSSDNRTKDNIEPRNRPHSNASVETIKPIETEKQGSATETWQEAYAAFLRNFPAITDDGIAYFSLRDLDSNGTPELMLEQRDGSEPNYSILTVYSYVENVYKIDNYKLIGAGGLHVSDNPEFPGIFHETWGGGVQDYWYLTIEEGELISEYVRRDDSSGFGPEHTEFSDNVGLIEETINVYESDKFPDNLLEMYPINDDNLNERLGTQ